MLTRSFALLKDSITEWMDDSASSRAAALAYYCTLSLAPLLIIAISIAGIIFGETEVRSHLMDQIRNLVGSSGADVIQSMLSSVQSKSSGLVATAIGLVTLLLGATGVFVEMQDALNKFWGAEPRQGSGIWNFVLDRVLSFAMVLGIGFLLLVSLLLSTAISALGAVLAGVTPALAFAAHAINIVVSFAIVTVLFAMIYKILPNVELRWKDVIIGAVFTSALFAIGKFLIGLYLGRASATSAYGAAGSVVILLLWIYYSAQILYLGAEFTKVYACSHGSLCDKVRTQTGGPGAKVPSNGAPFPPKKSPRGREGSRGFDGRQRLV